MKISPLISQSHLELDVPCHDKPAVMQACARLLAQLGFVSDEAVFCSKMLEREALMSTGVGFGIGIPHAMEDGLTRPGIVLLRLDRPVDFAAIDGQPVDIVLGLAVPENMRSLHLQVLAAISRLCRVEAFAPAVRSAKNRAELLAAIDHMEQGLAFH
jgi:mannitol/fructose-specific phosphotransferase system IIA component (Ntr-type)